MNRALGTLETIPKGLIFVSLDSHKEWSKSVAQELFEEMMTDNVPKSARDINLQIQEIQ